MDHTAVICAVISAISAILCAYVASAVKKSRAEEEKRAERRKKEAMLSLQMASANAALTVGVAWALKRGHCNGEVEEGLARVKEAQEAYTRFEQEVLAEEIK